MTVTAGHDPLCVEGQYWSERSTPKPRPGSCAKRAFCWWMAGSGFACGIAEQAMQMAIDRERSTVNSRFLIAAQQFHSGERLGGLGARWRPSRFSAIIYAIVQNPQANVAPFWRQ